MCGRLLSIRKESRLLGVTMQEFLDFLKRYAIALVGAFLFALVFSFIGGIFYLVEDYPYIPLALFLVPPALKLCCMFCGRYFPEDWLE